MGYIVSAVTLVPTVKYCKRGNSDYTIIFSIDITLCRSYILYFSPLNWGFYCHALLVSFEWNVGKKP